MIETADQPAKPKRYVRSYSQLQRAEVLKLYAERNSQPIIAHRTGIPQQTIARWVLASKCHKDGAQELANRVKDSVQQAVEKVTARVTSDVELLIADSLRVGRLGLNKAETALKACNGRKHVGALVQGLTAAKLGKDIARQALGLDDERAMSQNIRINHLVIQSRSSSGLPDTEDVIDIASCGVSELPLTLTPTTHDTTSDKIQ